MNQPNVYIGLSEGTSYSCSNNQGSNVFLRQTKYTVGLV
jgi:hypothetical protein